MLGLEALPDRFLDKILFEPNSGCWLWMAAKDRRGYGAFHIGRKMVLRAHRYAYEQLVGPIPQRLPLDHLCRVRTCVNPAHLEAVPARVNQQRGHAPWLLANRAGTCIRGHPRTVANTAYQANGYRRCRECVAAWARRKRAELNLR